MFPKEHGAYGQLLFPIATALFVGDIRWPAAALSVSAVCAFLAHEPLLVLLGQRGPRARRDLRARAWKWLLAFGVASIGAAIAGVLAAPAAALAALTPTIALAAGLAGFIATRREHTVAGESWMSVTMASFAAPLALAAGAAMSTALTLAVAFAGAFVAPTVAVHAVIAFTRKPPAAVGRSVAVVIAGAILAAAYLLTASGTIAAAGLGAMAPACIAAAVLAIRPPSARRLRVVGWTLVGTSSIAALVLILGL